MSIIRCTQASRLWAAPKSMCPAFLSAEQSPERTNHAKGRTAQSPARIVPLFAAQTKRRKDVFP